MYEKRNGLEREQKTRAECGDEVDGFVVKDLFAPRPVLVTLIAMMITMMVTTTMMMNINAIEASLKPFCGSRSGSFRFFV